MRRRSTGPAVALFPFLAVLLCAMGALILLLLVLARQVREEVLHVKSADAAPATLPEAASPPATIPVVTVVVTPPAAPPPVDPNVELRERLAALTSAKTDAARKVERIRQAVDRKSADVRSMEAAIAAAAFDVDAVKQRLKARSLAAREREAQHRELSGAVARAENDLAAAQTAAATAEPKVSIIPFDGRYGTVRRPVLIECTAEAIRFLPEGVELSAGDLDGFQADYNPLLAGVVALRRHWSAVDGPSSPQPYVLLLVRENGVAAYYAARAMLRSLDGETGYELITDDLSLDLPDVDPQARDACRNAVLSVLRHPSAQGNSLAGGGSLFPSGRFEVDPAEHDPTRSEPSPLGERPDTRRSRASLPPAAPLGSRRPTGGNRQPGGSLPPHRPLPTLASSDLEPGRGGASQSSEERSAEQSPTDPPRAGDRLGGGFGAAAGTGEPEIESQNDPEPLPLFGVAGAKRRWGKSAPTSNIALERPVALLVTDNEIVVGVQPPIPVVGGVTPATIRNVFAAIEREAEAWGRAPGQFYWSPRLTATVRPGGTGHLHQLERALGRAGLRVSSEIVLAPSAPAFLELNHAETAP